MLSSLGSVGGSVLPMKCTSNTFGYVPSVPAANTIGFTVST